VKASYDFLVTGGAGFIGSHLCTTLVSTGRSVLVLDDLSTGRMGNIAHLGKSPLFRFNLGSVMDRATVTELAASCGSVIHLAAAVGVENIIRHPVEGAARLASELSSVPVINAGDGSNQHPTQTFLDLFTIFESVGRLEGLCVGLMGDLKYGRTVHSLAHAMALFGARMVFISPSSLAMPPHVLTELAESGVSFRIVSSPEEAQDSEMDVLYVTRIQKERFGDPQEYESVAHSYRVTRETVAVLGDSIRIMHPLPRVDEIAEEVDSLPNAIYFRQAHNGIPTRQALLGLVTGGIS